MWNQWWELVYTQISTVVCRQWVPRLRWACWPSAQKVSRMPQTHWGRALCQWAPPRWSFLHRVSPSWRPQAWTRTSKSSGQRETHVCSVNSRLFEIARNDLALITPLSRIISFSVSFSTFLSSNQCKIETKCNKHIAALVNLTWNVSDGYPTIPPIQLKAWFINPRMARKAIRLAAMLATRPMEVEAPLLAASRMFCSSLRSLKDGLRSQN